jgi:hypothetical protein
LIPILLQAAAPAITIAPGAGNELAAQVQPFEESQLGEVKAAVANAMSVACKGRPIGWGDVIYRGAVAPGSKRPTMVVGYRQTFRCLDLDLARYPHAPADWKAAAADQAAAARRFATFFSARDSGALDQAFAMIEPPSQGGRAQWNSAQQLARGLIGPKGERSITGIGWFLDPPEAPHPGIFAQLTFTAKFPGAVVYCGSMVLYRAAPDDYLIGGVRESILPVRDKPTAERVVEFRNQFCK